METCQIIEVALSDVLAQTLDPGCFIATNLAIDFGDIEDVDVNRARIEQIARLSNG